MTTLNDVKAAITQSIDPLEDLLDEIHDDYIDRYPWDVYSDDFLIAISHLEDAVEVLQRIRSDVERLIG